MKKVSLSFPTNDSLWSFKDQSKAINIRIEPKRNLMTGLFEPSEIDIAVNQFQAVNSSDNTAVTSVPTQTKASPSRFRFRSVLHYVTAVMKF
jgi:hypothetical protein